MVALRAFVANARKHDFGSDPNRGNSFSLHRILDEMDCGLEVAQGFWRLGMRLDCRL